MASAEDVGAAQALHPLGAARPPAWRRRRRRRRGGEEEEEFIPSGNWRGKHNSLSRGAGADQPWLPEPKAERLWSAVTPWTQSLNAHACTYAPGA